MRKLLRQRRIQISLNAKWSSVFPRRDATVDPLQCYAQTGAGCSPDSSYRQHKSACGRGLFLSGRVVRQCGLGGNLPKAKTFREIGAVSWVKHSRALAQFAGCIEAGNWVSTRIENLGPGVPARPSRGVRSARIQSYAIKWPFIERNHRIDRTTKGVAASCSTDCVVGSDFGLGSSGI